MGSHKKQKKEKKDKKRKKKDKKHKKKHKHKRHASDSDSDSSASMDQGLGPLTSLEEELARRQVIKLLTQHPGVKPDFIMLCKRLDDGEAVHIRGIGNESVKDYLADIFTQTRMAMKDKKNEDGFHRSKHTPQLLHLFDECFSRHYEGVAVKSRKRSKSPDQATSHSSKRVRRSPEPSPQQDAETAPANAAKAESKETRQGPIGPYVPSEEERAAAMRQMQMEQDPGFGPKLPGEATPAEEAALRALRKLRAEEAALKAIEREMKQNAPQSAHEEWMTALPDVKPAFTGSEMKGRSFSMKGIQGRVGDGSEWTETPMQKQARKQRQKLEEQVSEIVGFTNTEAKNAVPQPRLDENPEESLLALHQAKQKQAQKGEKPTFSWDRERDMAMGGRISADKKKQLFSATGLNSRFSFGT